MRRAVSNTNFHYEVPQHLAAGWLQDDWKVAPRLTLNLGVRYDVQIGVHSEGVTLLPWVKDIPHDLNNYAPRLGFAWSLDDRTVVRKRPTAVCELSTAAGRLEVLMADDRVLRMPAALEPALHLLAPPAEPLDTALAQLALDRLPEVRPTSLVLSIF